MFPGSVSALDLAAHDLLVRGTCRVPPVSTGSRAVDELLAPCVEYETLHEGFNLPPPFRVPRPRPARQAPPSGGVAFGLVTELTGPPSSGKTQLALSSAARAVLRSGLSVRYIAAGHSPRSLGRRFHSVCISVAREMLDEEDRLVNVGDGGRGSRHETEEEARARATEALDRITFETAADGHSLLMALARIEAEELGRDSADDDDDDYSDNGTLLIVDSASSVLSHHLSGDRLGPALLEQAGLTLRHLARTLDGRFGPPETETPRRFAVLVTNGSVARRASDGRHGGGGGGAGAVPATSSNKPAMGRYWHVADVGVWVEGDEAGATGDAAAAGDGSSVAGLAVDGSRRATATLIVHHGRSCRARKGAEGGGRRGTSAAFFIRSGGVGD